MLSLEKMSEVDFLKFKELSMANYKIDKMKANIFTEKEAQDIAEADFKRLLPDGFSSKDNFLFNLVNQDEKAIGYLWYIIQGAKDNRKAFIADIYVEESSRGQGLGQKAMELLESHVKEQGLNHIGLHVFAFNERAIGLYKKLGYQTTDLVMVKTIT